MLQACGCAMRGPWRTAAQVRVPLTLGTCLLSLTYCPPQPSPASWARWMRDPRSARRPRRASVPRSRLGAARPPGVRAITELNAAAVHRQASVRLCRHNRDPRPRRLPATAQPPPPAVRPRELAEPTAPSAQQAGPSAPFAWGKAFRSRPGSRTRAELPRLSAVWLQRAREARGKCLPRQTRLGGACLLAQDSDRNAEVMLMALMAAVEGGDGAVRRSPRSLRPHAAARPLCLHVHVRNTAATRVPGLSSTNRDHPPPLYWPSASGIVLFPLQVPFAELVLNPSCFTQTVENAFALAFLVAGRRAAVCPDAELGLLVRPLAKVRHRLGAQQSADDGGSLKGNMEAVVALLAELRCEPGTAGEARWRGGGGQRRGGARQKSRGIAEAALLARECAPRASSNWPRVSGPGHGLASAASAAPACCAAAPPRLRSPHGPCVLPPRS
jgi:hypothetical protein